LVKKVTFFIQWVNAKSGPISVNLLTAWSKGGTADAFGSEPITTKKEAVKA
jgi:hypothetical protein